MCSFHFSFQLPVLVQSESGVVCECVCVCHVSGDLDLRRTRWRVTPTAGVRRGPLEVEGSGARHRHGGAAPRLGGVGVVLPRCRTETCPRTWRVFSDLNSEGFSRGGWIYGGKFLRYLDELPEETWRKHLSTSCWSRCVKVWFFNDGYFRWLLQTEALDWTTQKWLWKIAFICFYIGLSQV